MFGIEKKVGAAARKAALGTTGALLLAVGAAFLTAAAWLVLAEMKSSMFAALVIGAVYSGLGVLSFFLAGGQTVKEPEPEVQDLSPLQLVAVSFLKGMEQGAGARRTTGA